MSINMNPIFKGALIVLAIVVAFVFMVTIVFVSTPSQFSRCPEKFVEFENINGVVYNRYRPHLVIGFAASYICIAIIISLAILAVGAFGFQKQSASILRHLRIGIIASVAFLFSAMVELQYRIGRFRGETWNQWEASGCTTLNDVVYVENFALLALFVLYLPFTAVLDAYLKSIGDELSFLDYLFAWVHYVRNCIKYGRQGISFTSSFVRSQVQTRLKRSVRVSQKNDTLFREVEIGSRMFGAITLELLKENIAHKYDRHPNEIIRLTKNGNVLIVDDADVMRIGNEDHIEVEFEDIGTKLREVDSVMLEDSISETTVDL